MRSRVVNDHEAVPPFPRGGAPRNRHSMKRSTDVWSGTSAPGCGTPAAAASDVARSTAAGGAGTAALRSATAAAGAGATAATSARVRRPPAHRASARTATGATTSRRNSWVAVAAAHRLADPVALTHAYRGAGVAYIGVRQYDQAQAHLVHALEYAEEVDDVLCLAQAHRSLGRLFARQGRFAEALPHDQRALDLWRGVGNEAGLATALEVEQAIPESVRARLRAMGHEVVEMGTVAGGMNAIQFGEDGMLSGAACWRGCCPIARWRTGSAARCSTSST